VDLEGIALFTGARVHLGIKPAPVNTGIVFIRTDLPGAPHIPALYTARADTPHRTTLRAGDAEVQTIEHLMAALAGLGVTNAFVELDGPEVPNLDGSALPFAEALTEAGFEEQDHPPRSFSVPRAVSVSQGNATLIAIPDSSRFLITYTLDYGDSVIEDQNLTWQMDEKNFLPDLAGARTFCLESEIEEMKKLGIRGGTYQNALVVGKNGVIENELRYPDEFVRHKILDLVGDLALLGAQVNTHIIGIRSGHDLNYRMVQRLADIMRQAPGAREFALDIRRVLDVLPHRYPFLLVDRVLELESLKRAVGIKNVTINEEFFQGHFPEKPIMPGVLQIEAMAQLAGILLLQTLEAKGKLALLLSIDKAKLRRPVVPGDQLRLEAETITVKSRIAQVRTWAMVEGKIASEAVITFILVDSDKADS